MTYTPPGKPGQPRADASNVYLVTLLRQTLGEQGHSFKQLVRAMRWRRDPEWLAGVTALAIELGLISRPKDKRVKSAVVIKLFDDKAEGR